MQLQAEWVEALDPMMVWKAVLLLLLVGHLS